MNESHTPSVSPILAIPVGILAVSTASIFIRFAQHEAHSLVIAGYRLTLASLVLTPWILSRRRGELASLRCASLMLALLGGLFLALHFASWITSLAYTTVASSVVLVSTTPLWVALAAPAILGERTHRLVLIGLLLALAGGVIVGFSESCTATIAGFQCTDLGEILEAESALGNLLALTGALMGAGYLLVGRRLRPGMSLDLYVYLVYGMASLILIAVTLVMGLPIAGYPAETYLWFLLLALIPQLLGHSTFNWALKFLPAAFVSLTLLGEPIGSTLLAYVVLQEVPDGFELFGAILILIGIYLASRRPPGTTLVTPPR